MRPPELPVDPVLPDLVRAVAEQGAVVLRAPTGAGKTTRVPPALLDAGVEGRVVVLQPRRVATRAAARRIASERGGRLGDEVGYLTRFQRQASSATRLLVVTEGILLRMLQDDPFLEDVGVVVFDEFHERSLQSDLALALVQRVRTSVRPDLRVVVMSATLDPAPVAAFLGDVPVVESEGRTYPVEVEHAPLAERELEAGVRSAVLDVIGRTNGDVLVFLPGVGEIRRCKNALATVAKAQGLDVLALHGELPPEQQDAALATGDRRKVILSTNVAETSLTIPGVRTVIDAGLERVPRVDPGTGLERLETVRIARESAEQRAGRAGRTAPGLCVRLWARGQDALLDARREPAVRRTDLSGAVLQLHAWGESDLAAFPWYEPPPAASLEAAETLLERLGALHEGTLTETGRHMARLPAHPRLARLLVEARTLGHARRLALAAAVLADRAPFVPLGRHEEAEHRSASDVLDAVEALEAFEDTRRLDAGVRPLRRGPARRALQARDQLARSVRGGPRTDGIADADEAVRRAVFAAYPDRLARRREPGSNRAVLVGGRGVRLDPASAVRETQLFVCVDVHAGRRGERAEAWVRSASAVDRAWLLDSRVQDEEVLEFDPETGSVRGTRRTLFEDLVLDEVTIRAPRGKAVERALAAAAEGDLAAALPLDDEGVAALRTRAACLAAWRPEVDLPDLGDDALRALLPTLVRGKRSFGELRRAPLLDHLHGLFTWEQRQTLDRGAPERLEVPSGSHVRLRYELGRPPVLAVRIQEVFGLRETPRIAGGRVKVLMHLLAPNHRPQQITDDMASFWEREYAVVRGELRRRYPRHAWPEDPLEAKPERRPRRR